MNTPNFLTALRVLLTFLTALLLCLPLKYAATAAFVIYCAAGATDWFDGYPAATTLSRPSGNSWTPLAIK